MRPYPGARVATIIRRPIRPVYPAPGVCHSSTREAAPRSTRPARPPCRSPRTSPTATPGDDSRCSRIRAASVTAGAPPRRAAPRPRARDRVVLRAQGLLEGPGPVAGTRARPAPLLNARARAAGRAAGAGDRARGGRPRGPVSLRGTSTTARALGPRRRHFPRVPGRRQTGPEEGRPRSPLVRRRRASRRVTEIGRVVATSGAGARSRRAGRSRAAAAADKPRKTVGRTVSLGHTILKGALKETLKRGCPDSAARWRSP